VKIRSVYFHDFRAFRGEVTISFCDELSGTSRPITVLAGNNGSGKTTVLEAIEALLTFATAPDQPSAFVKEAQATGLIVLELSFGPHELDPTGILQQDLVYHIEVGRKALRPPDFRERWPNLLTEFVTVGVRGKYAKRGVGEGLQRAVELMQQGSQALAGGLVYFPSTRRLLPVAGGPIEPPPQRRHWIERVEDPPGWSGSLEQLWVWANYLDLEQGVRRDRIRSYVESIEHLLGRDRQIHIQRGRAYVTQRDRGLPPVRLDALPSGEKQILMLLGELARRGRTSPVCLIDEPETSLHPALQHALVHYLRGYSREADAQFILATHSLEIVSAVPGGVVFLDSLAREATRDSSVGQQVRAA
jgi:predicted ATPase